MKCDGHIACDQKAPANLVGLALSGGGIRSATFNLGAMQAMREIDLLDQFDYVSAVSGGGYIAAWQQAHLGARNTLPRDKYAFEVGADTAYDLYRNHNEPVEHLRTHSGFLNQGGWFEASDMALAWLWRWPFHLLFDDVLHLRGRFNFHHVFPIYRSRIEKTYFRGVPPPAVAVRSKADTRLLDVNAPGREALTPYMILNANLTNRGSSRVGVTYPKAEKPGHQWNFEFTRDFVGSDATGYLSSAGFGLPVERVLRDAAKHPTYSEVRLGDRDVSNFTLSRAVAASGAAFDSLSVGNWIDWWGVSELTNLVGGTLLNLHLGLDVPNFARQYDGWLGSSWDYVRMFTFQRNPRWTNPGARWLYITDGGHYENLGVLALLRRGTRCVVAFDVGADPERRFGDLRTLRKRVEQDLGLVWATKLPSEGDSPRYRFSIQSPDGAQQAVILYIKASADPNFPHLQPYSDAQDSALVRRQTEDIQRTLSKAFEELLGGLSETLEKQGSLPTGFKEERDTVLKSVQSLIVPSGRETATLETRERAQALRSEYLAAVAALEDARRAVLAQKAAQAPNPDAPSDAPIDGEAEDSGTAPEKEDVAAIQEAVNRLRSEMAVVDAQIARAHEKEKLTPIESFDETRRKDVEPALANLLSSVDDKDVWNHSFSRVLDRTRIRLDRVANRVYRDSVRQSRRDRIDRIQAFAAQSITYPHDSTLVQWYTWERFEAYRALGYQMADTYLGLLQPTDDTELKWCDFPPALPSDPSVGTATTTGGGI